MAKLIALTNIRNDGERVKAGERFEASGKVKDYLIGRGAAREWSADDKKAETETLAPSGAERVDQISSAVEKLGDDDWTKDGKPKVAVVTKIAGFDVTADDLAGFEKPDPQKNG